MTAHKIVRAHEGGATVAEPRQWLLSIYNTAHDEHEAFGTGFNLSRLKTSNINAPGPRQTILHELETGSCLETAEHFGECDHTGNPILQDLAFRPPTTGKPLGFCDLRALMIENRPVVFEWKSLVAALDQHTGQPKGPEGDHYMVVVGTRVVGGNADVFIWDPWAKSDLPEDHLQWIRYNEYAFPGTEHGIVGPTHGRDYFQIRALGRRQTKLPETCDVIIPPPVPFVPVVQPVSVLQHDLLPENLQHTLPPGQLPTLERGQRFGTAFPIVALTSAQIVGSVADPARVRGHDASSALVTVMDANGHTNTFFSVVHDRRGWRLGGYVNNGVARQLTEARQTHWDSEREARPRSLSDYYMLSVPSRRTFFAAYEDPRTHETMFVPISDDPAIGAVTGKSQRARDLLLRMATDIEADWARQARQARLKGSTAR
jgi:hypothetical protein